MTTNSSVLGQRLINSIQEQLVAIIMSAHTSVDINPGADGGTLCDTVGKLFGRSSDFGQPGVLPIKQAHIQTITLDHTVNDIDGMLIPSTSVTSEDTHPWITGIQKAKRFIKSMHNKTLKNKKQIVRKTIKSEINHTAQNTNNSGPLAMSPPPPST